MEIELVIFFHAQRIVIRLKAKLWSYIVLTTILYTIHELINKLYTSNGENKF